MSRAVTINGRSMSPRTAALAYRIWGACQPGWGYALAEVADEVGETVDRVRRCADVVGWLGRFRMTSPTQRAISRSNRATTASEIYYAAQSAVDDVRRTIRERQHDPR